MSSLRGIEVAYSVSARHLAEFALEHGDLAYEMQGAERLWEGMEGHMRLQRQLDKSYTVEERVSITLDIDGIMLTVQGRADAVCRHEGTLSVEEIKTTHADPGSIKESDYPEHRAQAEIYAYIIAKKERYSDCETVVIYYNLNTGTSRRAKKVSFGELEERFYGYVKPYVRWIIALENHHGAFIDTAKGLKFPFPDYRDGQREMAANVFTAARDKKRALIEAPTGIGKTAASLFGAIKALSETCGSAVFYLTARTTGKASAEYALGIMRGAGLRARSVTITAKERVCVTGDKNCLGCPYAREYFSRHRAVLVQALETDELNAETIRRIALENELCPFELSLDMAETADIVICDYNYVFDPRVSLKRFFTTKSDCILLVDEAHNLPDRARDMLTAALKGREIAALYRKLDRYDPVRPLLEPLIKALKAPKEAQTEVLETPSDAVAIAAQNFADSVAGILSRSHPQYQPIASLMFDSLWYAKRHGEFDHEANRFTLVPEGTRYTATLLNVDPKKHIDACFKKVRSASVFSATLTPNAFYAQSMAIDESEGDTVLSLASPFPRENQLTMLMPVNVRYSSRAETLSDVCESIHILANAGSGGCIACFPSYAYLEEAYMRYTYLYPDERVIKQNRRSNEDDRADFIANFRENERLLAFVVLGGVFAEGIDLPGNRLVSAAVVTVGYPLICLEREIMRGMLDDGEGSGYDSAYVYPGFRRVLQAAGRVIRTQTDRGAVLLIDERFREEKYMEMMPGHWRVRGVNDKERLKALLDRFFSKETGAQ